MNKNIFNNMRRLICPGCGKEIDKSKKFCRNCKPSKDLIFKDINLKICYMCMKAKIQNNWGIYGSIEDAVIKASKKNIKEKGFEIIKVKIPEISEKPGLILNEEMIIRFDSNKLVVPYKIEITTCPQCSKINDTYLEGILQLRGCNDKVRDFVLDYVNKNALKGVNINKMKKVKGGEDFVFNNKHHLRRIAELLKKKFKGEMKQSAQHFSEDKNTGKPIYRLNVLFREE